MRSESYLLVGSLIKRRGTSRTLSSMWSVIGVRKHSTVVDTCNHSYPSSICSAYTLSSLHSRTPINLQHATNILSILSVLDSISPPYPTPSRQRLPSPPRTPITADPKRITIIQRSQNATQEGQRRSGEEKEEKGPHQLPNKRPESRPAILSLRCHSVRRLGPREHTLHLSSNTSPSQLPQSRRSRPAPDVREI